MILNISYFLKKSKHFNFFAVIVLTLILLCVILHEKITVKTTLGSVLITAGSLLFFAGCLDISKEN
jgi:hypothetical protein